MDRKGWRLIRSWYEGSGTCVKICNQLSSPIPVCRGVCRGSVLSPLLFIVLMDGLAAKLSSGKAGTTLDDLFVGGGLHADDLWTVSNDKRSVSK